MDYLILKQLRALGGDTGPGVPARLPVIGLPVVRRYQPSGVLGPRGVLPFAVTSRARKDASAEHGGPC
jgi:hypothetical protein